MKSDEAQGRIIKIQLNITLTPPETGDLGSTDAAWELGKLIVDDTARLLHIVCTNEGFKVDVERKNLVY